MSYNIQYNFGCYSNTKAPTFTVDGKNVYYSGSTTANIDIKSGDSLNDIVNSIDTYVKSSTVTSIGLSVPTGLTVTGSPITTSGTLAITFTEGYSIPTIAQQDSWDAKPDDTGLVHTTGVETIDGLKTFSSGEIKITNAGGGSGVLGFDTTNAFFIIGGAGHTASVSSTSLTSNRNYFLSDISGLIPSVTSGNTPEEGDSGAFGNIRTDFNYVYFYVTDGSGTYKWKRLPLEDLPSTTTTTTTV